MKAETPTLVNDQSAAVKAETKEKSPAVLLFENKDKLVATYRQNVAYTGAYLSTSMAYAYAKGINDAIKLLIKENKNVEKTETKAE